MAFDSLTDKLQDVFKALRAKGRLTEDDVKTAFREIKLALLEADVNFKVVKRFTKEVSERAIGEDVMNGLNPGQMVVKIVNEELIRLMGSEPQELELKPRGEVTVLMMMGLQGAGKTTSAAKLAGLLKKDNRKSLLVSCDVYRPAAIEQLRVNAEKVGVDVFPSETSQKPAQIAAAAYRHAEQNGYDILIIDTAGRLHIDQEMMDELADIRSAVTVDTTLLTVDAMTGQDAVNVAQAFKDQIGIDGVILTKLDGDTRGGAALSVRAVTECPIYYAGMGEKLTDLEIFYPERMASRILGMGDVLTLIDKAQEAIDEEEAAKLAQKVGRAQFDFNDYLESIRQMRKMGGLSDILNMLPGMGSKISDLDTEQGEKQLAVTEAIIYSMTPEERANPDLLNPSRKNRIARGSGVDISEVNRIVKQFAQTKKMMKQMPGMMKKGRKGLFGGLPF